MSRKCRVAVIGAGPSGLTSARQALQNGHDVCVFERLDQIGGCWAMACDPRAKRRPVPALSASLVSKEVFAFSELQFAEDVPAFLRPRDALQYLKQSYADTFSLAKHVRLRTEVREVERAADWQESGKWLIRYVTLEDGEEHEEQFDAVMCATGMRQKAWRPPEWRLEKQFKGSVIHSEQFANPADYRDQIVCVVGLGSSAVQIAAALALTAKQVLLSTRRGAWLLNRFCLNGQPWDRHFLTRCHSKCRRLVPKLVRSKLWQWSADSLSLLPLNSHGVGQKPAHNLLNTHLIFGADQLSCHLATGRIRLKPDIWSLSAENSVEFVDGTVEQGVDTLILCTGFQFDFGLVEKGTLLPVQHNDFHLYKHMFPPELGPHHSLAVIGHVQPVGGSLWPIAELQARLFCQVLQGNVQLPSPFWMKAEVEKRRCALSVSYLKTRRHTQMEDHIQFMDELARMIGADPPSLHRLLLTDPQLAFALWFGPFSSAQFRLWGAHKEDAAIARESVLKTAAGNYPWHGHCLLLSPLLLIAIVALLALWCLLLMIG